MIHTPVGADRSSQRNWSAPTVMRATMSPCRATPARVPGPAGGADGPAQHPGPGCAAARPDASRAGSSSAGSNGSVSGLVAGAGTLGVLLWAGTSVDREPVDRGDGRRDRPGRRVVGLDGPGSASHTAEAVGGPVCSRSTTLTTPEHDDRERHGRHDVGEEVVAEVEPAQRDQGRADDRRDAPRHDPRHRRVPAAHEVAGDQQERRRPDGVTRRERRRRLGAGHEHRVLGRPLASHQPLDREADQRSTRPSPRRGAPVATTRDAPAPRPGTRPPTTIGRTVGPVTNVMRRQHGRPPGGPVRDEPVEDRLVEVPQVVLLLHAVEHGRGTRRARATTSTMPGRTRPEHRAGTQRGERGGARWREGGFVRHAPTLTGTRRPHDRTDARRPLG